MTAALQTTGPALDGHAPTRPLRLVTAMNDLQDTVVLAPRPMLVPVPVPVAVRPMPAGRAARGTAGAVKVVIDLTAAAVLLLLIAPVLLVVAVAVRIDGGPVFFRQTRVGRDGRRFQMIKFRSMVVDAEQVRVALESADEGAGPLFKMRRDPRITRVGALLRRYSADELPQLLNVLSGRMSLVGPRPPLPCEVATYTGTERRRLAVRPGMTGLWQVSGRSDLSWDDSIRLDLRYVDEWTPAMELRIIAGTARAVLGGRGAY